MIGVKYMEETVLDVNLEIEVKKSLWIFINRTKRNVIKSMQMQ